MNLPKAVRAGQQVHLEIEVRDQMGFLASYPPFDANAAGYTFSVEVEGPVPVRARVDPLRNGCQTASFRLKTVGEYTVVVRGEDGTAVRDPLTGAERSVINVLPTPLEAKCV